MKVEKVFCTTSEAATILAISVGTVQLWVDSGLLVAWKTAGGHRRVPTGVTSSARAATVDVAPTLADFFGVGGPRGGYDGRSRLPRR